MHHAGPGGDGHDRTSRTICSTGPQRGKILLNTVVIDQGSHQGQFVPDLVIDPCVFLAVVDDLIRRGVVTATGVGRPREHPRRQERCGVRVEQSRRNLVIRKGLAGGEPVLSELGDLGRVADVRDRDYPAGAACAAIGWQERTEVASRLGAWNGGGADRISVN